MPSGDNDVTDKAWLLLTAAVLRKGLTKVAKIRVRLEPVESTNTAGWSILVGVSRKPETTKIEVWLDHYFGLSRPRIFWFGFHWTSRSAFRKACGLWERRVPEARRLNSQDLSVRRGTYTLKEPRKKGRP